MESTIINTAKSIITNLAKGYFEKLIKNNSNEYIQELAEIIESTIESYQSQYPIQETDKIPFYSSLKLREIFLAFRFTKKLDEEAVKNALMNDTRLIPPTQEEINNFFKIFDGKVFTNEKLKSLDIEINFKKEIFNINDFLKSLRDDFARSISELKENIKANKVSSQLLDEWSYQLDEILEDIKKFKAVTAKHRLENLEKRIIEQSINDDKLFARLYNLKSECLNQIGSDEIKDEHGKLLVKIYRLQPLNQVYKANAAFAYYSLGETNQAKVLANELVDFDEFNIYGWVIKCYIANENFKDELLKVPVSVSNTFYFKILIFRWLAQSKFIRNLDELTELKLNIDFDFSKPVDFSYKNMMYQHWSAEYLLSKFLKEHPKIISDSIKEEAKTNAAFRYGYEILDKSIKLLKGTEIEDTHQYYAFYYHFCSFIKYPNKESVIAMEQSFDLLKFKTIDVVIFLVEIYQFLNDNEYAFKALQLCEDYQYLFSKPPFIINAVSYSIIDNTEKKTEEFTKFIKSTEVVNRLFFINFMGFARNNKLNITEEFKSSLSTILERKQFSNPEYYIIFEVFCFFNYQIGKYNKDEINILIEKTRGLIDKNDTELSVHIALAYCHNGQEEDAKQYLREFVNTKVPSETLKLYCKLLYNLPGNKAELLEILKNWRENFSVDYEMLQVEFDLRNLQSRWDEIVKISKKGIEAFPASEYFYNTLFSALNNTADVEEIRRNFFLIDKKYFKNEDYIVNIAKALLKAALYKESIEILYSHAIKKENFQCRRAYIPLFIKYPHDLFKDYNMADIDSYVRYEINGKQDVFHVTEENKEDKLHQMFLSKKVGDTFTIKQPYTDRFSTVIILRISDKYIALFQELILEANNPLSGHIVQSFEFKGDTPEEIRKTLIENFGVQGSLTQENIQARLEKYYAGDISFSDIALSVYRQHYIDAYFLLTHSTGRFFKAITPFISNSSIMKEETKYVLDITSLCLFYLLEKECQIVYHQKFYISDLIREQVFRDLQDAKDSPQSELSISITLDNVIPHTIDDKFNERRVNTFQTILDWIDANCIGLEVPERLNLIADPHSRLRDIDFAFNILIECRLLADRENHVLLTNDVMYYRNFNGSPLNIVSPLLFLNKYYSGQQKIYLDYMLRYNYVGIPISALILKEEFYKFLSEQDNRFSICLENLRYSWNPNNNHINEAITFIKELYTNSFVSEQVRHRTVFSVFQNLIVGMDVRLIKIVLYLVRKEFNLLGIQMLNVLDLLGQAVQKR